MSIAIWSLSCYGTSMGTGKCWFNYFTITKQLPFFENHVSWLNILQKRVAEWCFWRNIRRTYLYRAAFSKKNEAPSNYSQWACSSWCNKHQTKTNTVRSKPSVAREMHGLQQCLFPKTRHRLDKPRWWAQQNFLLQRQHPSPQKRKQITGTIN